MQISVFRSRSCCRFATILVTLAVALQLLAVGVSAGHLARQIAAARQGEVVLCTPSGLVRLAVRPHQAPEPEPEPGNRGQCPFCLIAAGGHALTGEVMANAAIAPVPQAATPPVPTTKFVAAAQRRLAPAQAPPRLA
jgi:hypothetical protein